MKNNSWVYTYCSVPVVDRRCTDRITGSSCSLSGSQPAGIEINIDNFSFTPPAVTVKAGTQITWTNRDDIPHTVVSSDRRVQVQSPRHRR